MPSNTVNRGYPYSDPTDPADVAQAVEDLAVAVDADLVQISPTIVARRVIRVSRTLPISFGTTATVANFIWDSLDVNEGDAIDTFPGAPAFVVRPKHAGFWIVTGQASFVDGLDVAPGAPISSVDIEIDLINTRFARDSSVNAGLLGFALSRQLNVGGGRLVNGTTDYFRMAASIVRPAANPNAAFSLFGASMTLWQMTES